jgi:hypothetical protein
VGAAALAQTSLTHEFVPPDPREDLQLGTTTPVGELPSALETQSGVVSAPDPFRLPSGSEKAYGRTGSPDTSSFTPDRDTREVTQVDYDDPFSPTLSPFKRLTAFDSVSADYSFHVADPTLRRVQVGGSLQLGEDPFYGDLTVDLVAGEPVRIPSVGPGTRVLKIHTVPATSVEVVRDGADNFFLRGASRGRVRVLLHLAVPRLSLGGALRDSLWSDVPVPPALPRNIQTTADEVNKLIGVSRVQSFREVVERLVGYYRSFTTTDSPLPVRGDIFLDLATSKKGVCRHRAFGFVLSALAVRVPARLVTNEAHAWVEVHDGLLWHRVDLGGAASNFNDTTSDDRVSHSPPPDPFGWPPGSRSGSESAGRAHQGAGAADGGVGDGSAGFSEGPGDGGSEQRRANPAGSASGGVAPTSPPEDERPRSTIAVSFVDREVTRNQALHLEGKVESSAGACAYVRVDVALGSETEQTPLGSLATDENGQYQGAVVIPPTVGVGDHELVVSTPGDARCGKGRTAETP